MSQFILADWWNYKTLFSAVPPQTWRFEMIYAGLTILCFVVAIVVAVPKVPLHEEMRRRIASLAWTNALLGALFYFARQQRILYLGTDGLRTIQEIILVFWVNAIVLYYRTTHKKQLVSTAASDRFNKYLPKTK